MNCICSSSTTCFSVLSLNCCLSSCCFFHVLSSKTLNQRKTLDWSKMSQISDWSILGLFFVFCSTCFLAQQLGPVVPNHCFRDHKKPIHQVLPRKSYKITNWVSKPAVVALGQSARFIRGMTLLWWFESHLRLGTVAIIYNRVKAPHLSKSRSPSSSKIPIQGVQRRGYPYKRGRWSKKLDYYFKEETFYSILAFGAAWTLKGWETLHYANESYTQPSIYNLSLPTNNFLQ